MLFGFQVKVRKDKEHMSHQEAQSQKQLMEARRANIDKLVRSQKLLLKSVVCDI